MPSTESLIELARSHATLVLHLAIRYARELAEQLTPFYGADCPAVVVAEATRPGQQILIGTLADLGDRVETAGLRQAAVIMVGEALGTESVHGNGFVESHLYGTRIANRDRSGGDHGTD